MCLKAGTKWSTVGSTAPATANLAAVSAISGSDAWAAGQYCVSNCSSPAGVIDTLIMHWNGTKWSKVSSPSPSSTGRNLLFAVTAPTATSAWAVGGYPSTSNVQTALILHWNGTKWSKA